MEEKLIEKLSSATSAKDIKAMADEHGIDITIDQAEALFANLQAVTAEGKLSDEDKATLQSAVDEAKKDLEADDEEKYNAAFEELSKKMQPVIAKLYQQAGAQGAPGAGPEGGAQGGDEEFHQ